MTATNYQGAPRLQHAQDVEHVSCMDATLSSRKPRDIKAGCGIWPRNGEFRTWPEAAGEGTQRTLPPPNHLYEQLFIYFQSL